MTRRKWELIKEEVTYKKDVYNFGWGTIQTYDVFVDIYRKKKWNGTYKYKKVER